MPDPNFPNSPYPDQPLNLGPHPRQRPPTAPGQAPWGGSASPKAGANPGTNSVGANPPGTYPVNPGPTAAGADRGEGQLWSGRELGDRLVLERGSLANLGRISQTLLHPVQHRVMGVLCKVNPLGPGQWIPWEAIRAIGPDGVVVQGPWPPAPEGDLPGIALGGQEVWSDLGTRVGRLVDYHLWTPGGAIADYWIAAPGWQGVADGVYRLEPGAIISMSRRRMMVAHAALVAAPLVAQDTPPPGGEPWIDRPQAPPAVRDAWRTTLQESQGIAAQAQTQVQQLGAQARSRLAQWAGQVKQRTRHLRAQVNDRVADVAANLQERRYPPRPPGFIPGRTIDVDAAEIWPEDSQEGRGEE